jgi:hypothetical protein
MSSVIPRSSDSFSYKLARTINQVDSGEVSFIDAVDTMQRIAERSGLIERWGVDKVQAHMARAFKDIRRRPR